MAGISSKSAGGLINKKGYNGNELQNKEFSDGGGLDLYDFNARTYDQQIGRFLQIDPKSELENQENWTPYHFTFDNPIIHSDPDGTHPIIPILRTAYSVIKFLREVPWSRNAGRELPIVTRDNVGVVIRVVTPILKDALTPTVVKTEEQSSATTKETTTTTEQTTTTTNTKKDRVVDQKPGEKVLNQKEGIEKAQDNAKKEAPPGEKQNKINSVKKSEQNLKKELKNIKSLKDAIENF